MKVALAVVAALAVAAPSYAKSKKTLAGGETCGSATGIICTGCPGDQSINYTDNGTTTGAVNDNGSVPMACAGGPINPNFAGVGGPDVVYVFTATAPVGTTNLTITVTPIAPDAAWDPAIYVLTNCGTCRAKRDENGIGQPETLPAGIFYSPGSNHIFVDSALSLPSAAAAGNYRIDVTGFVPVELMKLEVE